MRKPKVPGAPEEDTPPGGHAADRAREFARQRGLPPPAPDAGAGLPEEGAVKPAPAMPGPAPAPKKP